MSKYYLIHKHVHPLCIDSWYLLERGVDFQRWQEGKSKVSKDGTITKTIQTVYQSDTIPEMLHQIQDNMDWRFYVVTGTYNSLGETRQEKYENHRGICTISGFVDEVCDIRERDGVPYGDAKWELDYITELWVCPGGYGGNTIYRVEGFTEKMNRSVRAYISEHELTMGRAKDEQFDYSNGR